MDGYGGGGEINGAHTNKAKSMAGTSSWLDWIGLDLLPPIIFFSSSSSHA
jgi:hypothetical protein